MAVSDSFSFCIETGAPSTGEAATAAMPAPSPATASLRVIVLFFSMVTDDLNNNDAAKILFCLFHNYRISGTGLLP
jgi:hypothetical protein